MLEKKKEKNTNYITHTYAVNYLQARKKIKLYKLLLFKNNASKSRLLSLKLRIKRD